MKFTREATDKTPEVVIDKEEGKMLLKGISVPENPHEFYRGIISEFENYLQSPNTITEISLHLAYMNTSSAMVIRDLLRDFESQPYKTEFKIKWLYDEDDTDMRDVGNEFQYLAKGLNFELIGVKDSDIV